MKNTTAVLVLAIGAATIGISFAPLAAADPTENCQQIGATTVCGQGRATSGGQPAGGPEVAARAKGGCTNVYGGYQNCNMH